MVLIRRQQGPLPVPALPAEQRRVVRWLATAAGRRWSRRHFDDATECHELIELVDDCDPEILIGHLTRSSRAVFNRLRQEKEWADLTWTPDRPP